MLQKIMELVSILDQRKDELIERTFKGVARHFREVFSELVQGGHGYLVMMKKKVCERSGGQLASPGPVASRSQQVLSSILIRSEFQAAERKKKPSPCSPQGLALMCMSQGSRGFSTRVSRLGFL